MAALTTLGPTIGMGLAGVVDWSTEHPFLDRFKTAREWIANGSNTWDTGIKIPLDSNGWPKSLPNGVQGALTIAAVDPASEWASGRYIVTYDGKGTIDYLLTTSKNTSESRAGYDVVTVSDTGNTADLQSLFLSITSTNPADPIRNIHIVREDQYAAYQAGEIFNPEFLAKNQDWREMRFMDWMNTNNSKQFDWNDRPEFDSASWSTNGVPVEVMVELANRTGVDPWFNMPHLASDDYITKFATYVRDHLDPRLKAHVEYSNEVWNWQFEQAQYAMQAADKRWAVDTNKNGIIDDAEHIGDGWVQFSGMRTAQTHDIWTRVFGAEADARLDRVIATQTGWKGLEQPLLDAPLYVREGKPAPSVGADSYAIAGYFNGGLYDAANVATVLTWAKQGEAGLARAFQQLEFGKLLDDGGQSLADIKTDYAYHANVAKTHKLLLTMYESGAHLVSYMYDDATNDALTAFFKTLQEDPRMGQLYAKNIAAFKAAGGTLFNSFVDVSVSSKWGYWGSLDSIYDDSSARWDAFKQANNGTAWEARDPEGFANGKVLLGTAGIDKTIGTLGGDNITGAGGNDYMQGNAGSDRMSGGIGNDYLFGDAGYDVMNGDVGDDRLYGGAGRDKLSGGDGRDILIGEEGADLLDGGAGIDIASYLNAGVAGVRIALDKSFAATGDAAYDTLISIEALQGSNTGNDTLTGDGLANELYGAGGNDTLNGKAGNDFFLGGTGADILTGGTGNDRFEFRALADFGDRISDFSSSVSGNDDVLSFAIAGFNGGLTRGALALNQFEANTTGLATSAATRFIFDRDSYTFSFDSDGAGGQNAVLVATLQTGAVMTNLDILLV